MKELWRAVVGHEGSYEVSNKGRVRSIARLVSAKASARAKAHYRRYSGHLLRPGRYDVYGHVSVTLGRGAGGSPVHKLVMEAFVGPRPKGLDIRHKNGKGIDNRLCNLAYATRSQNNEDMCFHGKRKLTTRQVRLLRKSRSSGAKYKDLSIIYKICVSEVGNVVRRRHYARVV